MSSCNLTSVDVSVSPNHKPALMASWLISYKCNLDCSYCTSHDNTLEPVPYDECIQSMKFILEYADVMLSIKRPHERRLALSFIGGEPMLHPEIDLLLSELHKEYNNKYKDKWDLSVCVTTNGTIGTNVVDRCVDYVDFWTISYHAEALKKQKEIMLQNVRKLHSLGKRVEVRVMATAESDQFDEASQVHSVLRGEGINALMKPITGQTYKKENTEYFKIFWQGKSKSDVTEYTTSKGITCCSERPLMLNSNIKDKTNFIPMNNFKGWYCGLNYNFLNVNHLGEVYHNISCHASYKTSKNEPLGLVRDGDKILNDLRNAISTNSMPVVVCPNDLCTSCGMCSPKASTKEEFTKIMKLHLADVSILDFKE